MSGLIWGAIEFHKKSSNAHDGNDIVSSFNKYRIDEFHTQSIGNAVFGAGIIYVNQKKEYQNNPYYDEQAQIFIVVDSIIDNRQELIEDLSIDKDSSDTKILIKAYQKWGSLVAKYIVGDFAFVIYDIKNNIIVATRDHLGQRSLYYYQDQDVLLFSTTIGGIVGMKGFTEVNEEWFSEYLTLPHLIPELGCKKTPIKDIYQMPFAKSLCITSGKSEIVTFWNPLKDVKQIRYKKDEEYLLKFNQLFHQAVACRLDTVGETGILLSGGLDSTAIAAEAASILKDRNRKLYGYSYIPVDGYSHKEEKGDIYSEKDYVNELCKRWDNIQINYIQSTSKNSLSEMEDFIDILELPYKGFDNIVWINECIKQASQDDCRIVLGGQFGNVTISKGSFFTNLNMLMNKGKILRAIKEVHLAAGLHNVSEKIIWKKFIHVKLKCVRDWISLKEKTINRKKVMESLPIKFNLMNKWETFKKAQKVGMYSVVNPFFSINKEKKVILDELPLSVLGVYSTKQALAKGIIIRDPTKDISLIEYSLAIPYSQYVRDGADRNLIRRAMKDKVPDQIRLNYSKRGVQGADWKYLFRIQNFNVADAFNKIKNSDFFRYFIEEDKINRISEELQDTTREDDSYIRSAVTLIVAEKYFSKVPNNFEL